VFHGAGIGLKIKGKAFEGNYYRIRQSSRFPETHKKGAIPETAPLFLEKAMRKMENQRTILTVSEKFRRKFF